MNTVTKRLRDVRVELDECSEQIERLAADITIAHAEITPNTKLVGTTEIAKLVGKPTATIAQWATRNKLPAPVAHLACGRIWLRSDIEQWMKRRRAA